MKKFVTALICATFTFVAAGFAACVGESVSSDDTVKLVSVTAAEIGVKSGVDYYVVPEPAASAKAGAIQTLEFVGDLQELYGGENGYPQAVIVVNNEFLAESGNFIGKFLDEVIANESWLTAETTSAEMIVNAVSSHLTEGMAPTFDAANLTKTVIEHCGISFTPSAGCKSAVTEFMNKLNGVASESFGTPADKFFLGDVGTTDYDGAVTVYAPDGAPALGIARLLAGETELTNEIDYNIVDATTIQTYVTGSNPAADICILPVNLAVKLLGSGEKYSLAGTLTNGNLYMLSDGGQTITSENVSSLAGKTVGIVNLAQIPGLTFKLILKNYGLEYEELV